MVFPTLLATSMLLLWYQSIPEPTFGSGARNRCTQISQSQCNQDACAPIRIATVQSCNGFWCQFLVANLRLCAPAHHTVLGIPVTNMQHKNGLFLFHYFGLTGTTIVPPQRNHSLPCNRSLSGLCHWKALQGNKVLKIVRAGEPWRNPLSMSRGYSAHQKPLRRKKKESRAFSWCHGQ